MQSIRRMAGIGYGCARACRYAHWRRGGDDYYPSLSRPGTTSVKSPGDCTSPFVCVGECSTCSAGIFLFRNFDIIHFHCPFIGCGLAAIFAKIVWRKKLLVTYHMDLVGRTGFLGILFKIYQFFIIPLILAVADGITVTSNAYAQASAASRLFFDSHQRSSKYRILLTRTSSLLIRATQGVFRMIHFVFFLWADLIGPTILRALMSF